jgi:hypothetical protein
MRGVGPLTEDVDVKTRTTWALALVTTVLWGCGEQSARPAAQTPAANAETAKIAPAASVTAVANAAPTCPTPPATVEAARVATTPVKTTAKSSATSGKLTVKRLVVAQGVKGREPVDAASSFSVEQAKKIYAFVEVENKERAASEITVSFEPPDGGDSRGNVKLAVGAEPRWRTWAFTRTAHTAGAWTAVVKDARGEVLARAPFEITL